MRRIIVGLAAAAIVVAGATPAFACGGLVNPNGTVSLTRTTTFAGYRWGVEHYVTSFEFQGGGARFGSIVPLPGIPTKVRRGGDWTLQRLVREVRPPVPAPAEGEAAAGGDRDVDVILKTEIDSLDITVLKGAGRAVGRWAERQGFVLSPDAPEVLDFYGERSPIFMAAAFDPKKAKKSDKQVGDGVPIHLNIPTDNPWVPLRILGLGVPQDGAINADVFLLTRTEPALLPEPQEAGTPEGVVLDRSEPASRSLLADLRSDKGMRWMPRRNMWLTYLRIDTTAGDLTFDLATNLWGEEPSAEDAGVVDAPDESRRGSRSAPAWAWVTASFMGAGVLALGGRRAPARKS